MTSPASSPLLLVGLEAAVPLWIEKVRGLTDEQRQARAARCGQLVASKGDVLMFGSKRKGEAAGVFNVLAEGLACGAFVPGGITFGGRTWTAS